MDSDIDKKPIYLKMVTLMDVVPGRADKPDGEAISIITVEHKGEIERPMLFNLRDTKKLAVMLLAVLGHHGDEKAQKIISEYFTEAE
jgi:hypothetical protein